MFVPEEIALTRNAILVGLCSGADFAMEEVEKVLPRNTCALIKSSFGFKLGKVCPFLTVFAESEVTSLIAKGQDPREIALGLHTAMVRRAVCMLRRVSNGLESVVFAGGMANNACMRELLADSLIVEILVPETPQMTGALGAALLAAEGFCTFKFQASTFQEASRPGIGWLCSPGSDAPTAGPQP